MSISWFINIHLVVWVTVILWDPWEDLSLWEKGGYLICIQVYKGGFKTDTAQESGQCWRRHELSPQKIDARRSQVTWNSRAGLMKHILELSSLSTVIPNGKLTLMSKDFSFQARQALQQLTSYKALKRFCKITELSASISCRAWLQIEEYSQGNMKLKNVAVHSSNNEESVDKVTSKCFVIKDHWNIWFYVWWKWMHFNKIWALFNGCLDHILPCTLPLSSPKHSERDILYVPQDISEVADVNINWIQFHVCPKL